MGNYNFDVCRDLLSFTCAGSPDRKRDFEIEWVSPHVLKAHPVNPRKHSEKGLTDLVKCIEKYGWLQNIVARRRDNVILIGNGRRESAIRSGEALVPVLYVDFDDVSSDEVLILDNAVRDHSKWDNFRLSKLHSGDVEDTLTPAIKKQIFRVRSSITGDASEMYYGLDAEDQKLDVAIYPKGPGKWGIPEFDLDWLPTKKTFLRLPIKLYLKANCSPLDKTDLIYWWLWGSDALPKEFTQRVICAFYREDNVLRPAMKSLENTIKRLWYLNVDHVITPDLTVSSPAPLSSIAGTLYERQRLSVVFALNGFRVIPDLPSLDEKGLAIFFEGFPKGLPMACISLQNAPAAGDDWKALFSWSLAEQIRELGVRTLFVYGGNERDRNDLIPSGLAHIICVPGFRDRMTKRSLALVGKNRKEGR